MHPIVIALRSKAKRTRSINDVPVGLVRTIIKRCLRSMKVQLVAIRVNVPSATECVHRPGSPAAHLPIVEAAAKHTEPQPLQFIVAVMIQNAFPDRSESINAFLMARDFVHDRLWLPSDAH